MKKQSTTELQQEHIVKANDAAHAALLIAGCVMEDIAEHICGCKDISVQAMVWQGLPGFYFQLKNEQHRAQFESFWNSLLSVKADISAQFDPNEKTFVFDAINSIPDFVDAFLTQYTGEIPTHAPLKNIKTKTSSELEPEDLLLIKRDSYLGEKDFQQSFLQAQQYVGKNPLAKFRYMPYDLRRSVQAVVYALHGETKYPTNNVFRIH